MIIHQQVQPDNTSLWEMVKCLFGTHTFNDEGVCIVCGEIKHP